MEAVSGARRRVVREMGRLLVVTCLLASLFALAPAGSEDKEDVGTVIGIDLGTTYSW